jgi:uncharacterized protein YjgD (DUF1641 family)
MSDHDAEYATKLSSLRIALQEAQDRLSSVSDQIMELAKPHIMEALNEGRLHDAREIMLELPECAAKYALWLMLRNARARLGQARKADPTQM